MVDLYFHSPICLNDVCLTAQAQGQLEFLLYQYLLVVKKHVIAVAKYEQTSPQTEYVG
jgi:hypothetical protein